MRDRASKIVIAAVLSIAVVRAALGRGPEVRAPITDAMARDAYHDITGRERQQRRDAAVKFPGDPWSQDDDFHERASQAVRNYSSGNQVRMSDVLRSLDDGMRAHWPASQQPQATVAPCRPRLSY